MPICLYGKAVSRRIPREPQTLAGVSGVGTIEARDFSCVRFCTFWILNNMNVLSLKTYLGLKEGNGNDLCVKTWRRYTRSSND